MFKKWLDTQEDACWNDLFTALKSDSVQLNAIAREIQNLIINDGKIIDTYIRMYIIHM